ncbi:TIGR01777 family oxidoreductase [Echinicola marina]|uniref:TIGR01777 family oxidoreductase n=1 Tax=Echinicola marina TaxID=2859768 RepID=UPI001CF6FBF8|nr:TIGR01777 family oxidoreductase [Echinicola marina]UCS94919.1 TIGR01777 family oxidoreductase [Echinicola marina]
MKNILITGGSGLVGQKLTKVLEKTGYQVAWLSRFPEKQSQKSFSWDINQMKIDRQALEWADAIVHLAGAGVAEKRWTAARKKLILESRTLSAQLIFDELRTMEKKPEVLVSASGANYYGLDNGEKWLTEADPAGHDFLAEVVVKWERSVEQFNSLGIRTVTLRTGIVLAKDGGALPQMLQPPVAAPLGDGKQYMSWIHIQDLVDMFSYALEHKNLKGPYNAVSPLPVSNKVLTQQAAKLSGKPFVSLPAPGFLLKIVLGEMAGMILGGNRISSDKMISAGYKFKFTEIAHALKDLYP